MIRRIHLRTVRTWLRRLLCRHPQLIVLGSQPAGNRIKCADCWREWAGEAAIGVEVPALIREVIETREERDAWRHMAERHVKELANKAHPIPKPSEN